MRTTLIALHGYTMNGAVMRAHLGPLAAALEAHVDLVCPDAPLACAPDSVERLYALWQRPRAPGPHRTWWDSNDDGSVYRGFEDTRDTLAALLDRHEPAALLGFSQGAMLAAAIAALAVRGEAPPIRFAVLVAGRVPRAVSLQPLFTAPIDLPSLHVWGERDTLTGAMSPALRDAFVGAEALVWPGPHVVPSTGPEAERIVDFVRRHAE